MHEPSSWKELYSWLDFALPHRPYLESCPVDELIYLRKVSSATTQLSMWNGRYRPALEKAAKDFADLREDAMAGLPDDLARLCLVLRLTVARDLARSLGSPQMEMIAYPAATFREILAWLLIDWWAVGGIEAAGVELQMPDASISAG